MHTFLSQQALGQDPAQEMHIIAAFQHAHTLGAGVTTRHFRNGTEIEPLMDDPNYDFYFQEMRPLKKERTIKPVNALAKKNKKQKKKKKQKQKNQNNMTLPNTVECRITRTRLFKNFTTKNTPGNRVRGSRWFCTQNLYAIFTSDHDLRDVQMSTNG